MARTKSEPPSDQCNTAQQKSDPLTKWATRAILLFITLATFSWLDTIKVTSSSFLLSFSLTCLFVFLPQGSMVRL
jgi:hypothetical protein